MTKNTSAPGSLLDTAIETYRAEILPALGAQHRYVAAMIANALEIAARTNDRSEDERVAPALGRIYGSEPATRSRLATDIRAGRITDATHPQLRSALGELLRAELAVRNPRFVPLRERI